MNELYKLNMLLREMNWMSKEVDRLLTDLSRDEERGAVFETWYSLLNTKLIEHMKEHVERMIEEMEEQ